MNHEHLQAVYKLVMKIFKSVQYVAFHWKHILYGVCVETLKSI